MITTVFTDKYSGKSWVCWFSIATIWPTDKNQHHSTRDAILWKLFFLILSLTPIILLQLKCLTQSIRSGAGMLMQPVQSGQEIFANIIRVRLHLTQSLGSQLFPFLFSIFQVPVIKVFQYEILTQHVHSLHVASFKRFPQKLKEFCRNKIFLILCY